MWGGFWGLLFGLLFFIPFAGWRSAQDWARCSATWERRASTRPSRSRSATTCKPGTSALFMVIEQATPDKAIAALQQYGGTVIKTSLSDEDTEKLQDALQPPSGVPAS